ncbi:hypothetical protein LAZ67_1000041 [Cordylochernes scorpioides]|uniref:Uncharacterized protein n=1 Tax=Cordylochernes scorpioides TaxID=51811 RepID=A0ABY6JVW6_9ARAC|nr:hypothetical protein LAZ67_1000041 [Cordylochernes scorpioides]
MRFGLLALVSVVQAVPLQPKFGPKGFLRNQEMGKWQDYVVIESLFFFLISTQSYQGVKFVELEMVATGDAE